MIPILRIARATSDLPRISEMYRLGLGLEVLAHFEDHRGFDGVILGHRSAPYHFEFTSETGRPAPRSPSAEDLMVFYLPDPGEHKAYASRMERAGFTRVTAHNPYWEDCASTFEDPEGYRVVLCTHHWKL